MKADVQDGVLALLGTSVIVVGATDVHLRYVRAYTGPQLTTAGLLVLGVGVAGLLRRTAGHAGAGVGDPDHQLTVDLGGGHRAPRTAWLLLLPVAVLMLITPQALGAYSAARSPSVLPPRAAVERLGPDRDGAVDLSVLTYAAVEAYAPGRLQGRHVRLLGFVTHDSAGWWVTRIQVSCCAADGRPVRVRATGPLAGEALPDNTWVQVVGVPPHGDATPQPPDDVVVTVSRVTTVEAPNNPYL